MPRKMSPYIYELKLELDAKWYENRLNHDYNKFR